MDVVILFVYEVVELVAVLPMKLFFILFNRLVILLPVNIYFSIVGDEGLKEIFDKI